MIAEIDITHSCPRWDAALGDAAGLCRRAVFAALEEVANEAPGGLSDAAGRPVEISIVLADDAMVADLNLQFRDREGATNVLSFPALPAENEPLYPAGTDGPPMLLGDVVLAFETVAREAEDQGKKLGDHLTHLVIHGILHLLGYDHLDEAEAQTMEQLEIRVLGALGVPDPYVEEAPFVA
ncbi:MAG: rRNA maturation RNase YbeY [Rhodospirillales bacterium]|nr:rRNA maturation RNase YbeY [Rhodospirillales bacterium]